MIFNTKKNKIISLLLLFLSVYTGRISYAEEEFPNFYWSDNIIGPYNTEVAQNLFLQNKKINKLEGIWFQEYVGKIVILKSNEINGTTYIYKKYIVDHLNNQKLNGTLLGTLFRTKNENNFIVFERPEIILENKLFSKNDNVTGILKYDEGQKTATIIFKGTKNLKKLNKKIILSKLYPKK